MVTLDKVLLGQERLIYQTHLHWILFFKTAVPVTAPAIVVALLGITGTPALVAFLFGAFFGPLALLYLLTSFLTTTFAVTNLRVLSRGGLLVTKFSELLLANIDGLAIEQSPLGKQLGFGEVIVTSSGGYREVMRNVREPELLVARIREQIEEMGNGRRPANTAATAPKEPRRSRASGE